MSPRMEHAKLHWHTVPAWITALVEACDATSQNQVAKRLGRSPAVVSEALKNRYRGDVAGLEKRVMDVLQPEQIACPALGPISTENCLHWRDRAAMHSNSDPLTVRMFRACRNCPRYAPQESEQ